MIISREVVDEIYIKIRDCEGMIIIGPDEYKFANAIAAYVLEEAAKVVLNEADRYFKAKRTRESSAIFRAVEAIKEM